MSDSRELEMLGMYKEGNTLQEISDMYGLSGERVRQLIKPYGANRYNGGSSVKTKNQQNCKVDGCLNKTRRKNRLCEFHRQRLQKYGTTKPDDFKVRKWTDYKGLCLVDKCNRKTRSSGLCHNHYSTFNRQKNMHKNIQNLNEFLKVQKAKNMLGKKKENYDVLKKFIDEHAEYFLGDFVKKAAESGGK